jgi:hypothetical protein
MADKKKAGALANLSNTAGAIIQGIGDAIRTGSATKMLKAIKVTEKGGQTQKGAVIAQSQYMETTLEVELDSEAAIEEIKAEIEKAKLEAGDAESDEGEE